MDTKEIIESNNELRSSYLLPGGKMHNSELIIGIVSAVGSESRTIIESLKSRLEIFEYHTEIIKLSSILPEFNKQGEYQRIRHYMKQGDKLREESKNNAILAAKAIKLITHCREQSSKEKRAYIIDSLKHPDEVELLRKVYGDGFYLFGIHADEKRRMDFLIHEKGCSQEAANELIKIDENENFSYGQKTRDTYHLADFFLNLGSNGDAVKNHLQRFLNLIFSNPHLHPTFDEFAMFMAFNSSIRSGDLSRQVGAVISKNKQIISTGANDVPKFGGGLYWAEQDNSGNVNDFPDGKDYKRGVDSNKQTQAEIIQEIIRDVEKIQLNSEQKSKLETILRNSKISDLTEFGRVVHAEMEAILACGREGISTINAILYCTTFPCHNCAKHIIASGIKRVVYVEPYPKSKALEFHSESIELRSSFEQGKTTEDKVIFEPFIGVGPRRFLDLFSMSLGAGSKLKRKQKDGRIIPWEGDNKSIRTPLLINSYLELEKEAITLLDNIS
ncbi:cytidine deaminase [Mannheimia granulomatis]|nr:cytidine deaminase [Mannheimia granulomatis]